MFDTVTGPPDVGSDDAFDLGRQGWAGSGERYQHGNYELSHDMPPVTHG